MIQRPDISMWEPCVVSLPGNMPADVAASPGKTEEPARPTMPEGQPALPTSSDLAVDSQKMVSSEGAESTGPVDSTERQPPPMPHIIVQSEGCQDYEWMMLL
jgi:hypothetical protein